MQRPNKKRTRRIRNLIVLCTFSAIILIVSTYAWFIGMRTVNVNPFEVEIASAESLMLSLNGSKWTSTINISKDTLNTVSYSGHTNSWGGDGLIPMSTIGDMDSSVSRMKLFEKASLTPSDGGYRLMASRVRNYGANNEQPGYVAFDLFVRNFSGTQYIITKNEADEEAIYLTTNSAVSVAADGVADTGIENSVRVAFAQIGRVAGTTTAAGNITAITCGDATICTEQENIPESSQECTTAGGTWDSETETCSGTTEAYCTATEGKFSQITGICRKAQIWEPNDTAHIDDAIRWYNAACKKRVGVCTGGNVPTSETACTEAYGTWDEDTSLCSGTSKAYCEEIEGTYSTSFAGSCTTISDKNAYHTYAVKADIVSADKVDVYDGEDYNTYTDSNLLEAYDYFTDTEKMKTGTSRPQFMTLAPNSITKVRIYIYIEGQDIDNYDFASIGRKISVKFGFTKERFEEEDIDYNGPNTPTVTGVCTGGRTISSEAECETARGIWNSANSTCSANTFEYCTNIGGTFLSYRATGTCEGSVLPTTKAACETAYGTWNATESECVAANTYRYCLATTGTFTAYDATGTCTGGNVPESEGDCGTAFGTWDGEACSGETNRYCSTIEGTFLDYRTVGTCTGGDNIPDNQTACEAINGTWAENACTGTTNGYCNAVGGTFAAE